MYDEYHLINCAVYLNLLLLIKVTKIYKVMKHNYFVLLILFFICSLQLFPQIKIVNKGDLKIMPFTNVYFENTYINDGNHNNDGNLHLKGDFMNNGITASASGTTFFNSATNAIQTISGTKDSVFFYNLEVNLINVNKKGVSVADGFGVIVTNNVNIVSGDFRLLGQAQLKQTHIGSNANTGTGKLLRDQQGVSTKFGYNYWSSPVNNNGTFALNGGLFYETADPFLPTPFDFTTELDGFAGTISERWLYTYSPNNLGYAGWDKIYRNSPINPGEGFSMKGTGVANQNYVFKGLPNDGDYTFTIAAGQSALLGNPYPSALNSWQFIKDNLDVFEVLYFWVDGGSPSHYLAAYLGAYAIRNLTTGVAASIPAGIAGGGGAEFIFPTKYIAVAQGFFVEASGVGTSVVFKNSQRTFKIENSTDSNFYKNSGEVNSKQKYNEFENSIIRIGYEDPEKFHRQLALGFLPNSSADLNYNRGYDAIMPEPREDELFFILEKDVTKKYVIQGVNAFDENNEFDLGLIITEDGEHNIMLDAVENFMGKVYIKDMLANIAYDLSKGNFKPMLPPGTYLDRFRLVFKDKTATVVSEDINPNLGISVEKTTVYYHENGSLIVRAKNDLQVNSITVFNMLGQQIKQMNDSMLDKSVFIIPFQYPIGVYLVVVESELGKENFKIINK